MPDSCEYPVHNLWFVGVNNHSHIHSSNNTQPGAVEQGGNLPTRLPFITHTQNNHSTEVFLRLYTLSTPPTKETTYKRKENS